MPRFIVKLTKGSESRYLEWSTVVDAPVTNGMTLEAFRKYYLEEYGRRGEQDLEERLMRVETQGHSTIPHGEETLQEFITGNRAGPQETALDLDGLWEYYCDRKEKAR